MMMNPMILKIALSLLAGNANHNIRSAQSVKHDENFLGDMMNALNAGRKKSINLMVGPGKTGMPPDNKDHGTCLEIIRKALAERGISPENAFLKEKDLPLIKTFLIECGFSIEKIERLIKEVKESNPCGDIKLSHLFLKINEMQGTDEKKNTPATLEPSAVPYIESVLRDFGLSSKASDDVINAAKIKDGGLDLDRFLAKLKKINGYTPASSKAESHSDHIRQISPKVKDIDIHRLNLGKTDQASIKNFISSLEQVTGRRNKGEKLSPEMKATVEKIIAKITSPSNKVATLSGVQILSDPDYVRSMSQKNKNKWDQSVKIKNKYDHQSKNESISISSGKEESAGNKTSLFHLKDKGDSVATYDGQHSAAASHFDKAGSLSDPNGRQGLKNTVQGEGVNIPSGPESVKMPLNATDSNYSEVITTVKPGETPLRDYLPGYLMDQVGKQISRSLLRGDQIVRLQLKPPELGVVKIKMDIKDHTLKLGMITEHSSVKELLLANIHELRASLVQQGLKLESLDVQINYNFGQTLASSKEGMDNGRKWGRDLKGEEPVSMNGSEVAHLNPMALPLIHNLLDLVA